MQGSEPVQRVVDQKVQDSSNLEKNWENARLRGKKPQGQNDMSAFSGAGSDSARDFDYKHITDVFLMVIFSSGIIVKILHSILSSYWTFFVFCLFFFLCVVLIYSYKSKLQFKSCSLVVEFRFFNIVKHF